MNKKIKEEKPTGAYTIHIPCTTVHRDRKESLPRWVRWLDILEKGLRYYEKSGEKNVP